MRRIVILISFAFFSAGAFAATAEETSEVSHSGAQSVEIQEGGAASVAPAIEEPTENEGCIPSEENESILIC